MTKEIGVIGLGKMGGGIARRLQRSGMRVVGFDHDPDTGSALQADGIELARSLEDLTRQHATEDPGCLLQH